MDPAFVFRLIITGSAPRESNPAISRASAMTVTVTESKKGQYDSSAISDDVAGVAGDTDDTIVVIVAV